MIGGAVGELRAGMEKVLKVLDPEALSGPESLELFNKFHRIERLAAAGKTLCARQMAATQAWYSGGHRSPCHLMAEATGSSVRYALDLERGHTEKGEVCEVPGVGPVTVAWVQSLLPDAVVAALLVEDGEVLRVAHLGRFMPANVRTALIERDQSCVVPGCAVDCDLEIDHIKPIAAGGRSELANLCRLCRFHHYLKTHHGWRISRGGKRWLWEGPHGPPPDPEARQPELAAARR